MKTEIRNRKLILNLKNRKFIQIKGLDSSRHLYKIMLFIVKKNHNFFAIYIENKLFFTCHLTRLNSKIYKKLCL